MSRLSADVTGLSDCGCCEGQEARTPMELYNRPGLSAIAYRTGAYNDFMASMQARLSTEEYEVLSGLRTRDQDDYTIALLDAWAVVSDVLSFYQERFANESYLRTATERLSILEQARLIGYELSPGVAASTYLAFTMDDPPGASDAAVKQTTLETGIKVQSTPGPGEDPQLYETVEEIEARVEWNEIRPRQHQPQLLDKDMTSIIFAGTGTGLAQGDSLLLVLDDSSDAGTDPDLVLKAIHSVTVDDDANITRVDLQVSGGVQQELSPSSYSLTCDTASAGSMDDLLALPTSTLSNFENGKVPGCWKMEDIVALAEMKGWTLESLTENIDSVLNTAGTFSGGEGIYAFRQAATVFGYNAPKQVEYDPSDPKVPLPMKDWSEWTPDESVEQEDIIFLDNGYEKILPDSYVVITRPFDHDFHDQYISEVVVEKITEVNVEPHTAYGISGKTTKMTLSRYWWFPHEGYSIIRSSAVLAQSEQLPLDRIPVEDKIEGKSITLDGPYLYLRAGQNAILTGERADLDGITESEVVTLKEVLLDNGYTVLVFENDLKYQYLRSSVTINANVALATHGETVTELLGSGDAGQANQKFVLKQVPLTYVGSDTPSGVKSTLEVRVDGVLWKEVSSLYDREPEEHIYTTFMDDDGKVTVQFGDGINGARLTSGTNNLRATYRKGIGLGGLVKAKQLDLLMTRPLGLKSAINPLAPAGADDPEQLADARDNAPLTVLTLDRAVSLQDYEDFSRAFAGIAKAMAIENSAKGNKQILITVAGPDGAAVEEGSKLYDDLSNALTGAGDPLVDFRILTYRSAPFRIDGNIIVDPDYVADDVLDATKSKLRESFSFTKRNFGQPVMLSEVIAIMQDIPGVLAVDIDKLYRTDGTQTIPPQFRLDADLASQVDSSSDFLGAELLVLDPAPLTDLGVKS